jgi:hypothetical protein
MISIPFSASSNMWDEFELDGVVTVGEIALEIEYEGSWTRYDDDANVAGQTEWKATKLSVAYRDIVSIALERTWVRTSFISLRTSTVAAFDGFPLAKGVLAEIPVARRHRADASDLVAEVSLLIAEASSRVADSASPERVSERPPAAAPALAVGQVPLA